MRWNVLSSRELIFGSLLLAIAIGLLGYQWLGAHAAKSTDAGFFTIDDGATYFKASFDRSPYSRDGREATRVILFSADGGKTCFVGYLIRPQVSTGRVSLSEVRRPGPDQPWIAQPPPRTPASDPRAAQYAAVTSVRSPGTGALAAMVEP